MNTNTKLAKISEVMSDGFLWLQMRSMLESTELENTEASQQIGEIVDRFYKLCVYIERSVYIERKSK